MQRTSIDHIVLLAGDLEKSVAWYDAFMPLVGFEKPRAHVYLHADGWAVELRPAEEGTPPYGRYNAGLNHIGLTAADGKAVLAVRDAFAAKGFDTPEPQIFNDYFTVIFFRDPDGMRWEIGHIAEAD